MLAIELQLVDSIQFNGFSSLPLWSTLTIGLIEIESVVLKLFPYILIIQFEFQFSSFLDFISTSPYNQC